MAANLAAVPDLLRALDLTGVLANALLGGAVARKHRLDPIGFAALAILSGLGGGLIRDVLMQRGTPVALTDYTYLSTALIGSALAFVVQFEGRFWDRLFPYLDALALGCWAATGAQKTLVLGLGWLPAVLLGMVTAVGGGAVRDIALGNVPTIFGGNTLYASCALIASGTCVILQLSGQPEVGLVLATLVGALLCLLARWRGWILPDQIAWRRPRRSQHGRQKEQKMATMSRTATVLTGLDGVRTWQEALYQDLHRNPELSHQERRTAAKVSERLGQAGYQVHQGVGGTGVVGVLANGDGATVLLRADMDALPVREATGLPYASTVVTTDATGNQVPVAHACGHDVHVSCLLGAAQLLADGAEHWSGTLAVLFQPAEELGDGARRMVDDGLAGLIKTPDVALAQHVLAFPAGRVGTHAGPFLSAADSMRITVYGRGAHGSMPQAAVDPVVLAAMIVIRLQTIVSREIQPGEFAVVTVGSLQAGSKSNVIDDHAVIQLNIRSYSQKTRDAILAAIRRIVTAECQASDSPKDAEFELFDHFPITDNDPAATERVAAAFTELFGDRAGPMPRQTASEDFSDIPTALGIPYTYWGIGGTDADAYRAAEQAGRIAQDIPVNHAPTFAPVIQPTLDTGTQALVAAALASKPCS